MPKCRFQKAWMGECGNPTESNLCEEHEKLKCSSCGSPATHDCEETGMFVCGAPLCNECEHTIFPEGHNGGVGFNQMRLPEGMKRHTRKDQQRYKPWYDREEGEQNA